MLIDFYVSNFKSYDYSDFDDQGIDMIPSSIRSKPEHLTDSGLLRSSVIFGANSSGKSSIIDAISFIKAIIVNKNELDGFINTLSCLNHASNLHKTSRFSFHIEVNQKSSSIPRIIPNKASSTLSGEYRREFIYEIELKLGYGNSFDIVSETIWKVEDHQSVKLCSYHMDLDESYYEAQQRAILESNKINQLIYAASGIEFSIKAADIEQKIDDLESIIESASDLNDCVSERYELDQLLKQLDLVRKDSTASNQEALSSELKKMRAHFKNVTLKDQALIHEFNKESFLCAEPDYSKLRRKYNLGDRNVPVPEVEEAISLIFSWFNQTLVVVNPHKFILPNMNSDSFDRLSEVVSEFDVGIEKLVWHSIDVKNQANAILDTIPDHDLETIRHCYSMSTQSPVECSVVVGDLSGLYLFSFWHGEPVVKKLMTMHTNDPVPHDLIEESNGTRRLIELCSVLIDQHGDRVYVVDELDCRLHPLVSRHFIESFFNVEHRSHHSQLIVSTHETRLMSTDLFRLDEIWLVDRKEDGCSSIHNAADSMKVPYHKRLDRMYLFDQVMGGVPHLN